jgi:hypothetical protein
MPVTLVLRHRSDLSPFRRLLLGLITAPGARSVLIGSGYIWEPSPPCSYRILADQLGAAIASGCAGGEVTLIAGKLTRAKWLTYYENFIRGLRQLHPEVIALYARRKNWHAKIAIRHDAGQLPIAALVGSSNLTGPAFAEPHARWNYECDALIWPEDRALTQYFRDLLRDFPDEHVSRLDLILDPAVVQPTEAQQIKHLREQVLTADLEPHRPREGVA